MAAKPAFPLFCGYKVWYTGTHVERHYKHRISPSGTANLPATAVLFRARTHQVNGRARTPARGGSRGSRSLLGAPRRRGVELVQNVGHGAEVGSTARGVVWRWQDQYLLQLSRPSSRHLAT